MKKKPIITPLFERSWAFFMLSVWVLFVFLWFFTHPLPTWPPFNVLFDSGKFPLKGLSQRWQVWRESLTILLTGFWFTGVLWSCGRRLRDLFPLNAANGLSQLGLDWGLGIVAAGLFWMGLGLTRLWFEPLWLVAILGFSFPLVKDLLEVGKNRGSFRGAGVLHPVLALVLALYLLFLLPHSLLPETFYDSLNYFLAMPHFWLFQHGIADYPTHLLSGYFHGGSLFYMGAFVLAGTESAKVLSLVLLLICGLFAAGWVRELSGKEGAGITLVAVVTFPLLYLNALAVRVDILLTFSLLLFFYCVQRAIGTENQRSFKTWAWGAGLFAALALSVKPTAIVGLAAVFLACLWTKGLAPFKNKDLWPAFLVPALFEVGPWFLKNAAFTGNPFFPYALWMGGRQFCAQGVQRLLAENQQFLPMDQGFWSFLNLPWRLSMPQAGDGQFIGPLILAFLPALFLLWSKDERIKFLTRTLLLLFLLGLCLSHMLRFSLPAFVLALMVLSVLLVVPRPAYWKGLWLVAVVVCALLCFGRYWDLSALYFDGVGIWAGKETREGYLARRMPNSYEPLVLWTDANLPSDARLLIVGDARGLYYQRAAYANSVFEEPFLSEAAREAKGPADILEKLHQLGITDLVVNIPEGQKVAGDYGHFDLKPAEWRRLNDLLREGLEPLYWKDYLAVYHVKPALVPSGGTAIVNPFSFFCPAARDLRAAWGSGDSARVQKDLRELLSLFPGEAYWLEKWRLSKS